MDCLSQFGSKIFFYLILLWLDQCLASTKVYTIENDKVCSPIKKRHIHIGIADASSVIVKETRYFDTPLELDFKCKFKVETANTMAGSPFFPIYMDDGIFAVIQTLSLRQDPLTGRCIDYIQFRPEGASWSRTFCGQMSARDPPSHVSTATNEPSTFSMTDSRGRLDVLIFVDKQPLNKDEKLDFTIAFSSFQECRGRQGYLPCARAEGAKGAVPGPGTRMCIWEGLFNDSVINCPYHGCPDEPHDFCSANDGPVSEGNGLLVALSALASLVIAFAVFLAVLWSLRKLGRACWGQCSSPTTPTIVSLPLQPLPSAPAMPPEPDKDPPPTYDSLFPNDT